MTDHRARPRVVIAGMGDSGLLTAIHLARGRSPIPLPWLGSRPHCDVVGISSKPGLLSGQELGTRISRPDAWVRDHWISFDRFRGLDRVRTVHGSLVGLDTARARVDVALGDGSVVAEPYDVLVISTGVRNGFWRQPTLQTTTDIDRELGETHTSLDGATSVAVIGGGAAAVSSAANIAAVWPAKNVRLYFPGARALPAHHPRVWQHVRSRLDGLGVEMHSGHRAELPCDSGIDRIGTGPVHWTTGQPPASADAVVWAIGAVRPNTEWLPGDLLDEHGFVRVESDLRVVGQDRIFAVGDVAATDPLRNSARNRADRLMAHNVRATLRGGHRRHYRPRHRRWGSVLGVQRDGLEVFTPGGRPFRFPTWSIDTLLQPWIVRRGIYRGIRDPASATADDTGWSGN
ncbi:FAD-dependent oxidoreductase [Gordonia mangrovi]|uniref:FAD-dependent oxidoreductase n=2 Tax=Gordonia mangrovi TaxID=2665643 RepID=UPI002D80F719|nr:FAD-dependent oxidoreductase [Gordonia mangrovi]